MRGVAGETQAQITCVSCTRIAATGPGGSGCGGKVAGPGGLRGLPGPWAARLLKMGLGCDRGSLGVGRFWKNVGAYWDGWGW